MTKTLLVLLAGAVATPLLASESYTVDPDHTRPSFTYNHLGLSTQLARFNKVTGKITLDSAAKSGTADITIDANSLSTGFEKLDQHLKSDEFFDVAKYPTATFKSNKLKFEGDKLAAADGELTIRGVTKQVTLNVTSFKCGQNAQKKAACGADATATVKRSEFGLGKFTPGVSDEVKLNIMVEAVKD